MCCPIDCWCENGCCSSDTAQPQPPSTGTTPRVVKVAPLLRTETNARVLEGVLAVPSDAKGLVVFGPGFSGQSRLLHQACCQGFQRIRVQRFHFQQRLRAALQQVSVGVQYACGPFQVVAQ